jgi:predicted acylesterase/phospholipase RssA
MLCITSGGVREDLLFMTAKAMTMDGKDSPKSPKGGRKTEDMHTTFKRVVSEGSTVVLDVRDLVKDIDNINSIKYYSWKQTAGIHIDIDDVKNKPNFSFIAPYVRDNDLDNNATTSNIATDANTAIPPPYDKLSFQLTITDNDGKTKDPPYNVDVIVKRVQKAIIFQGGVALGAYEAGVFQAIVEKLLKNDEDKKRKGLDTEKRPLFDIVAGTSIGAMNAAIVVSSVIKKKNEDNSLEDPKNWKDSAEKVIEFWKYQEQLPTYADFLDTNPFYHNSWDIMHNTSKVFKGSFAKLMEFYSNIIDPDFKRWYENTVANWSLWEPSLLKDYIVDGWYIPATAEAARRYYSAKQFLRFNLGPVHVASGIYPWFAFGKFFDFLEQPNYLPRPDNKHFIFHSLKRTLERFADFPIKTSPFERKEPRLLLVTVDVKTGDAVTFDSYREQTTYHDNKNVILNHKGIEMEHALATGTFPDFFDYPKFKVKMDKNNQEEHIFWDGGFRSNTPLREVLQAHRDYWLSKAKEREGDTKQASDKAQEIGKEEEGEVEEHYNEKYDNVVPDLEIYIADLWPSELKEYPISFDRDFVENKKWNLILDGKTDYDEQVASVVTDYVDLTRRLKNLAERKGASTEEINHILNSYATSINTVGKRRRYGALLEGRFRLTKVVHVDRMDDENEVNDKVFDYSYRTIEELMNVGYHDALVQMDIQQIKDGVMELAKRNSYRDMKEGGSKNNNNHQIQELEESVYQIQEGMKVQNGYNNDDTIKQLNDFKGKVEQIGELLPKEEKASLIAAAERLREAIRRETMVSFP